MRPIKFKTILTRSPGHESGWYFVRVDGKIGEKFEKKNGSRRVVCTINGAETMQCALLPSRGDFLIVVNKVKRTKLGINEGDSVTVELRPDKSKYGLPIPPDFLEILKQDPDGDRFFHALTPGRQRTMIYFIGKVKDLDRRIHTGLIFVEHLKKNEGKIVFEQFLEELKRPLY